MTKGNNRILQAFILFATICTSMVCHAQLPSTFIATQANRLSHANSLVLPQKTDSTGKPTLKVMHIGDSHVKGNYFPKAVGKVLEDSLNAQFTYYGINGAHASRFLKEDLVAKVAAEQPDIIIVSFGTNESHAPNYDSDAHTLILSQLVDTLTKVCTLPQFVFTTPPGSYLRQRTGRYYRNRRGRRVYYYKHSRNETTPLVVDNISKFCSTNSIALWDIFNIAGGKLYACENWKQSGLMNTDQIHYTAAGYTLMGEMLGQAIVEKLK